jgi:hypothetical protein
MIGKILRTLIYFIVLIISSEILFTTYKVIASTPDTVFIQIWLKRSELNKVKNCKPNSQVRLDRPDGQYYVLPCSVIKEVR